MLEILLFILSVFSIFVMVPNEYLIHLSKLFIFLIVHINYLITLKLLFQYFVNYLVILNIYCILYSLNI